jgi:5-formyltetrahydrofolate cyclo-ligase
LLTDVEQTSKQASKQASKQTNKQASKQANDPISKAAASTCAFTTKMDPEGCPHPVIYAGMCAQCAMKIDKCVGISAPWSFVHYFLSRLQFTQSLT